MTELNNLIKKYSDNYKNTISILSNFLKYENVKTNNYVLRLGNPLNKFYIILEGRAAVLNLKEVKVFMTKEEYLVYLLKLKKLKENALISKIVMKNAKVFYLPNNSFDKIVTQFKTGNNFEKMKILISSNSVKHWMPIKYNPKACTLFEDKINEAEKDIEVTDNFYDYKTFLDHICVDEYIHNQNIGERKEITLYTYFYLTSIGFGQVIGENSFNEDQNQQGSNRHNYNKKNTMNEPGLSNITVIAESNCHMGYLRVEDFKYCLKDIYEKFKKEHVLFLIENPLLHGIFKSTFEKNYYYYFKQLHPKSGERLFSEGSSIDCLYFIKEGEFQISIDKNLLELNTLIKQLGGEITNENNENQKVISK